MNTKIIKYPRYKINCPICGRYFTTIFKEKTACSKQCQWRVDRTKLKKCEVCNKEYKSYIDSQKYCSNECSQSTYGRKVYTNRGIAPGTVGSISELEVSTYLLKNKFNVFRALSPHCYCDVIAERNGNLYQIEIRTGYRGKNNRLTFEQTLRKTANLYAVAERNTGEIILLNKDKKVIKIDDL